MPNFGFGYRHSHRVVLCPCGSGYASRWEYDARGIPLCRTCIKCRSTKMKKYRPEVLKNPNYSADEPIDPE